MRASLFGAVAFALLVDPGPAHTATASLVLEPNSSWSISRDDKMCHLVRTFGGGDEQIRLELQIFGPNDGFLTVVSGKPVATSGKFRKPEYRFEPDKDASEVHLLNGRTHEFPSLTFASSLEPAQKLEARRHMSLEELEREQGEPSNADFDREAEITRLTLSNAFPTSIVLNIGSMRAPMDQARNCFDELISSRGLDPKTYHSLSRLAYPIHGESLITSDDYPTAMLRAKRSDTVYFRVIVTPEGKPEACEILSADPSATFGSLVCGLVMKRANFYPALDVNGKPTTGFWQSVMDFRTPR